MHKTICIIISILFFCTTSVFAQIERVSVSSTGEQAESFAEFTASPTMSADDRFVTFWSGVSNLVADDTNNAWDIFVHDRDTGMTERVSVSSSGEQGRGESYSPAISADGRFVAFTSDASNLVADDTNNNSDIFVHDRDTGMTELVSVSSSGEQGNDVSSYSSISADGRFVAFTSDASNLVADDTNNNSDIFVHDRATGMTELVSVSSAGEQGNDVSSYSSISADGNFVSFRSSASNLVIGDTNNAWDIFVHERTTGVTERVSVSSTGNQGDLNSTYNLSISADGRFVAFGSQASNLVADDTNGTEDIFVHDRATGMTELVSVSSAGEQGNDVSSYSSISADGNFVAFTSLSDNLVVGDTNNTSDIFVHDRATGMTERVNLSLAGEQGRDWSSYSSISADGRFVAFGSRASNLVVDDTNGGSDIFVSENNLLNRSGDLSVTLRTTSGAVVIGDYISFRARLRNMTDQTLTNCKAMIINSRINSQIGGKLEFNSFSWPLNVNNPKRNGSINIAPGETGQFILAIQPTMPHVRPPVAMRREIGFNYICNSTQAFTVPFINSVHLTVKTEPLISEDYVTLINAHPKTQLVIDRGNGKYWAGYTVEVRNTGSQSASVNLRTTSDLLTVPIRLRVPRLCEPVDPANGEWSCRMPRAEQLQVNLAAGESKKIRVYVHAYRSIEQNPVRHRVVIEARDQAGDIVAKTSMGISTLN